MSLLAPHAPTLIRVFDKGTTEMGLEVGFGHELVVVETGHAGFHKWDLSTAGCARTHEMWMRVARA